MAVPITAGGGGALLKDIEYIYAVYKERSFSKAARRLFISQPSLSAAVKRVEQELGLPLFNRSTSPVSLTEAGEYYIKSAEKIMEIEREMRAHLAELAGGGPASLRVGSSMFFCSYVLPDIVGEFRKEHGSVVVTLSEGSSVALSEKLKDGSLDFMLEAEPPDKNIFESAVWTTEEIILAVPAAFAINGELEEYRCTFEELAASRKGGPRKPAAPPERFAGEEFLILTKWNDLHRRAMAICRRAGFAPKVSMYLEQMMTAYYLACEGKGIAFVRDALLDCLPPTDKAFFYRIDSPESERNIYLSYKKSGGLTQIQRDFIEFMKRAKLPRESAKTAEG